MTKPFKCVLDASIFARAAWCASKEETRYYLQGVQVEPCPHGGALLIGTDGRCMVVLRDEHAFVEGSGIVSLTPAMLKACTARNPRDGNMLVVDDAHACVVGFLTGPDRSPALARATQPYNSDVTRSQHSDVLIDGTFPNWRRVVPDKVFPDKPWGPFDPAVLAKVTKALCSVKGENVIVVPTGGKEESAIVFGSRVGAAGFGIVMPTLAAFNLVIPNWVRDKPAPKAKASKAQAKVEA